MALIRCPECGKEYSSFAKVCPNCGFPTELLAKNKNNINYSPNFKITKGILVKYTGDDEIIRIPNSVTKIGYRAFYNIKTAKQIIIPSSVLEICGYAFKNCNAEIIWDNPKVFSFHKFAFCDYEGENLIIPQSVTFVGYHAFENSLIKEIIMSPNVVDYGSGDDYGYNLAYCKNLKKIIIPEGLKILPHCFFYNCKNIEEINIPNSIEIIEEGMISECYSLLKLNHYNGGAYLGNESNPYLVFVKPDSTEEEVVLHEKCKFISPPCYEKYPKTKKFVFGNQKTDSSFPLSVSTTEYIETVGNDELITIDGVLYTKELDLIKYPEFRINKKFFIPSGVKKASIKDNDFLEEVELSDTVEYIEIFNCKNLSNIFLNNMVKKVSIRSAPKIMELKGIPNTIEEFHLSSDSIKSLYFPDGIKRLIGEISCRYLEQVRLPNDLEEIGERFLDFTSIKELSLPSTLRIIRRLGLPSLLNSLSLPPNVDEVEYPIGPSKAISFTNYGNCLYFGTSKNPYLYLIKAESNEHDHFLIHESCKYIEKQAFLKCSKLKRIRIPEGVIYIGKQAFAKTALEKIDIPGSVKTIDMEAFGWCDSLSEVTLHEGIEVLGVACFCSTIIEELVIPNSVKKIDNYAFENCLHLNKILLPPDIGDVFYGAFPKTDLCMNVSNNGRYIGTIDNPYYYFYKPISKEVVSFEVVEGCEFIMGFAFDECRKIKTIRLPKTVKRIAGGAFLCMDELEEIIYNSDSESWGKVKKGWGDIYDDISIVTNDSEYGVQKHPKCRVIGIRFEEQEKGCYYYLCNKTYKLGEYIWVDVNGESKRTKIVFTKNYEENEPLPYDYFSMKFIHEYPIFESRSNQLIYGLTPQEFAEATRGVRRSKDIMEAVNEYKLMKDWDGDNTPVDPDDSDYISASNDDSYYNSYDDGDYCLPDDDD